MVGGGRGTRGGVRRLLITSPNEMRQSNKKTTKRKEICYLNDKKRRKETCRKCTRPHQPYSLFIHTFIYFPTAVFWEHSENWKGNLERSTKEATDVILRANDRTKEQG